MENTIDITGIDPAVLLMHLHANTQSIGLGILHDKGNITLGYAQDVINGQKAARPNAPLSFDYVGGRPIKVRFNGNYLERANLYDRDAGEGACQRAVDAARKASKK